MWHLPSRSLPAGHRRAADFGWPLLLLGVLLAFPASAPSQTATPPGGRLRIIVGGDVMLDGGPGHALGNGTDPFAGVAALLADADVAICNLECAVASQGERFDKVYNFLAPTSAIPVLQRHFAAVCLANNHSGDYGHDAFVEELTLLDRAKLGYFGGGRNRQEAHRPWIVERNGLRVAFLGYNDFPPPEFEADEDHPGVAWLREEEVVADLRAAREKEHADFVIPVLHWGTELVAAPEEAQRTLARHLIDAGADAILGGHPHVTQTVEVYRGRPILYSLGNFVFDYFPEDPPVWTGWLVRLTVAKDAPVELETFGVELDPAGLPHLTPAPEPSKADGS